MKKDFFANAAMGVCVLSGALVGVFSGLVYSHLVRARWIINLMGEIVAWAAITMVLAGIIAIALQDWSPEEVRGPEKST